MRDPGDAVGAQHVDDRQRPQHVALDQRHLGEIDDLADRLRLRRVVHQHGLFAALDQNARDLRADQPRADHQCGHLILPGSCRCAFRGILSSETPKEKPDGHELGVLDHYNVSTRKLKETVQFYEDVLGFKNGPRPPFNFPGAWLYSGSHPVLHLNDISGTDKEQRADSGVIDHVAFGSRGFEAIKKHLTGKGIAAPREPGAELTRWQIFLRDPNNVEIELNFETKNEIAA